MRLVFRSAVLVVSALLALAATPALAANTPSTHVLQQPGQPVRIDMCALTYVPGEPRLTAHLDITNTNPATVSDVEFFFVTRDVFGESRVTRGTAHGTYSTDVPIRNVYTAGLLARSAWYTDGFCTVSRVVFVNGTKWSAGAGFLSTVIPSATGTPSALLSTLWPPGDE